MKRLLKNYSLSLALFGLFLASWIGQFFTQLSEFKQHATEHGQVFEWTQFWPEFWSATFENWQSEFLQLLTFVGLTSFLIHRGSPESKDSDEKMQQKLNKIQSQLSKLEKRR